MMITKYKRQDHKGGDMEYVMIRAIIRPEKASEVLAALMDAGFPAATKMAVFDVASSEASKWARSSMTGCWDPVASCCPL